LAFAKLRGRISSLYDEMSHIQVFTSSPGVLVISSHIRQLSMEEERKAREQSEANAKARATDTPTSPSIEGHEEYVRERRQVSHHLSFLGVRVLPDSSARVSETSSKRLQNEPWRRTIS
jgi:predicted nuclease with RNAse H fold